MRKSCIIMALLSLCLTMTAQPKAGTWSLLPKVGVTIANISNNDVTIMETDGVLKSKSLAGFQAGADAQYQFTDRLGVSLGAYYASLGNRYDDYELLTEEPGEDKQASYDSYTDHRTKLHYVQVPLMLHLYLAPGFAVKAGVQVGMLSKASTEFDVRGFKQDIETGVRVYDEKFTNYKDTSKDGYKKTEVSIPFGASYEYMNVVVDARYNVGLTKIRKIDNNSKNIYFTFTVGYRFQL